MNTQVQSVIEQPLLSHSAVSTHPHPYSCLLILDILHETDLYLCFQTKTWIILESDLLKLIIHVSHYIGKPGKFTNKNELSLQ